MRCSVKNRNKGKVQAYSYFLVEEDKFIGIINIRMELNDRLLRYAGNIGYGINPKYWNKCFSFINQNQIYTNKITFAYLRNIEIDYTILSFIFLDNKQFYILQFENFIKKIYFNLNQKKYYLIPLYIILLSYGHLFFNYNKKKKIILLLIFSLYLRLLMLQLIHPFYLA